MRLSNRTGKSVDTTVSTAFGLAITFGHGAFAGMAAFFLAVFLCDAIERKPFWKTMVNAAMYVIPTAAASLVLALLAGSSTVGSDGSLSLRDVGSCLIAGAVFIIGNSLILGTFVAISKSGRAMDVIADTLLSQWAGNLLMIAAAPIITLVAAAAPSLIPVLFAPLALARRNLEIQDQQHHAEMHDALTGLANRAALRERIAQVHAAGVRQGLVVLVDIDRFRDVNDQLGIPTGDALLKRIADRLAAAEICSGADAFVARIDGDDFVLVHTSTDPLLLAAAIHDLFVKPFEIGEISLEIQATVGVAEIDGDSDAMIRRSEIALRAARRRGERSAMYADDLERSDPVRLGLLADLRKAIDERSLEVHYQPMVSHTGSVIGCEALVRWQHPQLGWLSPDKFIPIAEQSGLVRELSWFVLEQAIATCAQWHRMGYRLYVAVNLSPRNLHDLDLAGRVSRLLDRYDLDPDSLVLEITEGTIMLDQERSLAILNELSGTGVRVALDDYGTGYSSLAMLRSLPLDELKIDKAFITAMTTGSANEMITSSTIDMAHRLGVHVIAEGVETPEVWHMLVAMGCDVGQGYFFRRPASATEITEWLASQQVWCVNQAPTAQRQTQRLLGRPSPS